MTNKDKSDEERHAVGHARHQVAACIKSGETECCFDYELVQCLLGMIDRLGSAQEPDWTDLGMRATWAYDPDAHAYYFAPMIARKPPYLKQVHVYAIIDVADDGTLAGVEIVDTKAPPAPAVPLTGENEK